MRNVILSTIVPVKYLIDAWWLMVVLNLVHFQLDLAIVESEKANRMLVPQGLFQLWLAAKWHTYTGRTVLSIVYQSTLWFTLCFTSKALNHSSYAPWKSEFQILVEVSAQILTIQCVKHFKWLRASKNLFRLSCYLFSWYQRLHPLWKRSE